MEVSELIVMYANIIMCVHVYSVVSHVLLRVSLIICMELYLTLVVLAPSKVSENHKLLNLNHQNLT